MSSKNRKFLFLVFLLLILIFPFWSEAFFGVVGDFLTSLLLQVLKVFLWISSAFCKMGTDFFSFALSNSFQDFSLTDPGKNPIIGAGWTLLRDLVNIFFILGFVWIGLATTLSLSTFTIQKMFWNIIIAILLINFTPVICGVIIDISNIISNIFLGQITLDEFYEILDYHASSISLKSIRDFDNIQIATQIVFLFVYGVTAGIILFFYGCIIFFRIPMIWILVIFSPLACFCWAFQNSISDAKKNWNNWWQSFTKWAFITIPAGFFIYLSRQVLIQCQEVFQTKQPTFIESLAPFLVALLFLGFGISLSFKLSAPALSFLLGGMGGFILKSLSSIGRIGQTAMISGRDFYKKRWGAPDSKVTPDSKVVRFLSGNWTESEKTDPRFLAKTFRLGSRLASSRVAKLATYLPRRFASRVGMELDELQSKKFQTSYDKVKDLSFGRLKHIIKYLPPGAAGSKTRATVFKALFEKNLLDDAKFSKEEITNFLEDVFHWDPKSIKKMRGINLDATEEVAEKMKDSGINEFYLHKIGLSVNSEIDPRDKEFKKIATDFNTTPLKVKTLLQLKDITNLPKNSLENILKQKYFLSQGNLSGLLSDITTKIGASEVKKALEEYIESDKELCNLKEGINSSIGQITNKLKKGEKINEESITNLRNERNKYLVGLNKLFNKDNKSYLSSSFFAPIVDPLNPGKDPLNKEIYKIITKSNKSKRKDENL